MSGLESKSTVPPPPTVPHMLAIAKEIVGDHTTMFSDIEVMLGEAHTSTERLAKLREARAYLIELMTLQVAKGAMLPMSMKKHLVDSFHFSDYAARTIMRQFLENDTDDSPEVQTLH